MTVWLLLAAGGGAGALARYAVAGWVYRRSGAGFPWGTLFVNIVGSFLLGVVVTGLASSPFHLQLGALLGIGFLGDFTTFSTLAYESVMLAREREWARALFYLFGSTVLAVLAVIAGMFCGAGLR